MARQPLGDKALTRQERTQRQRNQERWAKLTGVDFYGNPAKSRSGVYTPQPDREQIFIGLDGESVEVPGRADKYVLLAASDGSKIENWRDGLGTIDCFEYLLDLAVRHKNRAVRTWFLWFGMNYDINCILKDLTLEQLTQLHEEGTVRVPRGRWSWYQVSFHPGKRFVVSSKAQVKGKTKTLAVFNSQDVFGFSQRSYAKTLLGWQIVSADDSQFQAMESMKALRGSFASLDPGQVTAYNEYEIQTLAELGRRIYDTHIAVGLQLNSMHGAGATAGALLKREGVKAHVMQEYDNAPIRDAVLGAYYGGRIQLHRQGWTNSTYGYDLRSAYPAAAVNLPSLQGAEWKVIKRFIKPKLGVYHVRWAIPLSVQKEHALYPFPVRYKGHILWPNQGEGWYWHFELETALKHWKAYIKVLGGYELVINNPAKPFAFVPDLFKKRLEYKAQGSLAQQVLKLGLNAMYGKLAQKPIRRPDGNPQISPYQSFVYAGLITSLTRARLLDAAMTNPQAVVMFATDGIFTDEPLTIQPGDWLGDWESSEAGRGLFIQPGLYTIQQSDKTWYTKERGFRPSEIDWPDIRQNYPQPVYSFNTRRFVALGASLMRWGTAENWPGGWRSWPESTRRVNTLTDRWGPLFKYRDSWVMGYVCSPNPSEPYKIGSLFEGDYLLKLEYEELTSQPDVLPG